MTLTGLLTKTGSSGDINTPSCATPQAKTDVSNLAKSASLIFMSPSVASGYGPKVFRHNPLLALGSRILVNGDGEWANIEHLSLGDEVFDFTSQLSAFIKDMTVSTAFAFVEERRLKSQGCERQDATSQGAVAVYTIRFSHTVTCRVNDQLCTFGPTGKASLPILTVKPDQSRHSMTRTGWQLISGGLK